MPSLRPHRAPLVLLGLACTLAAGPARARQVEPQAPRAGAFARGEHEPRFLTRRQRALDDKPEWVEAADLDGDGHDELLATTITRGELLVWRGGASGLAREPRVLAVGSYPLRPCVGARAGGARGRLVWIASRGERTLAAWDVLDEQRAQPVWSLALEAVPRAFALGDLGADGSDEGLVALDGRRLALVRAGSLVQTLALEDDLARCAAISADGRVALLGFQATRSLRSYAWTGSALAPSTGRQSLGGLPRVLREADLDGDGERELLVAGGERSLWVFGWGAGGGSAGWFGPDAPARLEWTVPELPLDVQALPAHAPRAGLVLLSGSELLVTTWTGLRADGPEQVQDVPTGQTPTALCLLELDAPERERGAVDAVVANRDALALSVLHGRARGGFDVPEYTTVGGFPTSLTLGDFDGDGRLDALSLDSKGSTLSLLLAREGRLERARSVLVGPSPRAARALDLDGDGKLDVALAIVDSLGARLVRLFGDGRGQLARRAEVPDQRIADTVRDLAVLDATGDGAWEWLVLDDERDLLLVYGGDPAGELVRQLALSLPSLPSRVIALEADGDATPELAFALAGAGERSGILLAELRAGGDGLALVELDHLESATPPFDLAAADLDGDGSEELVALSVLRAPASPGLLWPVRVERGASGPRLVAGAALPTATTPRDVVCGDLDGDGRAEVLVCAQLAHLLNAWVARGAGETLRLERLDDLGAGIGPMAAALGDLDGDGQAELVVADGNGDDVALVRVQPR